MPYGSLDGDPPYVRRVDGTTYFVSDVFDADGRRHVVNLETVAANVSTRKTRADYAIGKSIVVQGPDDDNGVPGSTLACGTFALADAP